MTRILVTGGRNRTDADTITEVLNRHWPAPGTTLTVVHGDCPTGADRIARNWCRVMAGSVSASGVTVVEEAHPADWECHGKRAGPLRNAEMVRGGADVCEAFPDPGSVGTYGAVDLARRAGIPTTVHRLPDDPPKRVQRSRARGARLPASAVVVTRPGRWGNPYVVGRALLTDGNFESIRDPAHAVELHRAWLARQPELVAEIRWWLQGRDLACWCGDGPCHGETLLRVAAGGAP